MNPIEELIVRAQTIKNETIKSANTAERVGSLIEDFLTLSQSFVKDQFVMTGTKTVENTTAETSLINSGIGSKMIQPYCLTVGRHIKLKSHGYISTNNTDTESTVKIKFGGVTLIASTGTLPTSMVNRAITMEAVIRIEDDSHVSLSGYTLIQGGQGVSTTYMRSLTVEEVSSEIDFSQEVLIEHTYQWTTASINNSITLTNFEITIK